MPSGPRALNLREPRHSCVCVAGSAVAVYATTIDTSALYGMALYDSVTAGFSSCQPISSFFC
jgi:hypothetical protein